MHREQLITVLSTIAETLLSVPLRTAETGLLFPDDALVACVLYEGSFRGALSVTVGPTLGCALARLMIGGRGPTCSRGDVADAVGEIANIAAGNLRGLLAPDCQLSLPVYGLASWADELPLLARAELLMLEEPLLVELRGRSRDAVQTRHVQK
ncbi:MAG TPA: chemotaxis protein CheX [Polyangiales bacterium]|nr:chemotaxis protein CheX [Polyangiales bacterium]